jgi:uncharacterized membrane protein YcaP (DUF421 family)
MSQVREQGLTSLEEVREAYIEGDGRVSFIKRTDSQGQKQKQRVV